MENKASLPQSSPCNVVLLFKPPVELNTTTLNGGERRGSGVDCFNLRSYPILGQSLENHFVADCSLVSGAKRESRPGSITSSLRGRRYRGKGEFERAREKGKEPPPSRVASRPNFLSLPFSNACHAELRVQARLLVAVWGMS